MNLIGDLPAQFSLVAGIIFLAAALGALFHRRKLPTVHLFVLYSLISALFYGMVYSSSSGWLSSIQPDVLERFPAYGQMLVGWAFLGFVLAFLRVKGRSFHIWLAGLLVIAAVVFLDSNPLGNLSPLLARNGSMQLARLSFTWYAMLAACALLYLAALLLTARMYWSNHQPLHRNRLKYLLPIILIQAVGSAFAFARYSIPGALLHLLATLPMLQLAFTHELPDLRQLFRRVLSYLLVTLLTGGLFAAGFLGINAFFRSRVGYDPLYAGLAVGILLAIFMNPLLNLVKSLVERLLGRPKLDSAETVREYSQAVSNILDLELLAAVAVGAIRETLGAGRVHLIMIERINEGEHRGYHLKDIDYKGSQPLEEGWVSFTSPIMMHLCQELRPLTQYDIDLLPEYRQAGKSELSWFSRSGMDLYMAIVSHNELIGLLAIGPKTSGDRYFDEDLALLGAFANQTAVSLENARLVHHLVELNEELRSAYYALNKAKHQLEKLDQAKTDFISIASHELRTPLTLLLGYSEMLAGEPDIESNQFYKQTMEGILSGAHRLQEIVASMLDMAKIDSRTLDLAPKSIALPSLIQSIQSQLNGSMDERRISFETIELTNLPMIEADLDAVQKVFYNLIVNAVKYTPDGGKIKVMERLVPGDTSDLGVDSVEVVISDTGIGIDPQIQDLIFTKFYQTGPVNLHSTGKTKFKGGGPGLGLAIVRGIIDAHNGKVWVESPGYNEKTCPGSQFHVLLPLTQPKHSTENLELEPAAA